LPVKINVEGVIQEHAGQVQQGRTDQEQWQSGEIPAATQPPTRQAV
jgi:hypothetical protein